VPVFNTVKTDQATSLVQNARRGDIRAQRLVIVIRPSNGICAKLDHSVAPKIRVN
jgi:hypothetical protein